ncbi:MAG: peptidylprolyl isomerase [Oscillospiraceae bacterium]|nr:peptidylprolyl isomerase [Oscillospiraceae bacterium]
MKKIVTAILLLAFILTFSAACSSEKDKNNAKKIPVSDEGDVKYAIISVKDFGEITVELHPEYAPKTVERFIENVRSGFYTGRNFHRIISDFMIQGGSFSGTGASDPSVQGIKTEAHPDARHYYGAFCLAANGLGEGSDSFYIVNNKDKNAVESYKNKSVSALEYYQWELENLIENEEEYLEQYGQEAVAYTRGSINDTIEEILKTLEKIENMPPEIYAKYAETGGAPQLDDGYTVFGYTISGFDVIDKISAVEVVDNGANEISRPTQEIIIDWIVVKANLD